MNVAFVHPNYPGSEGTGATHSATQIVRGLRERGHNVTVYCTSSVPDEVLHTNDQLVELEIEDRFPKHFSEELNKAIRRRQNELCKFDIVHSYLMRAFPAIGELSRDTGVASVITLNAYLGVCPKNTLRYMGKERCQSNGLTKCSKCLAENVMRKALRYDEPLYETAVRTPHRWVNSLRQFRLVRQGQALAKEIDAFRAPSKHVKRNYIDFGFDDARLHVIPHPIDDSFKLEHESEFGEPYQLLYVGSLEDHKGVDRLVPIFEHLQEGPNEYELSVVGSGTLQSRIYEQIREKGLSENITLRGFVPNDDLPNIYSNSDVFLYPGRWDEPFARVFLEALATGTPIVTTDFGDIKSMLGEGCRTTEGSPVDFAKTIDRLVESTELPGISESAKRQVQEYNLEKILPQVERMYNSII